jgi:hypothetical protein
MFISCEQYRGPLTITLCGPMGHLHDLQPGTLARVSERNLVLPDARAAISTRLIEAWHGLSPPHVPCPIPQRLESLACLAQRSIPDTARSEQSDTLQALLHLAATGREPLGPASSDLSTALLLRQAIRNGDTSEVAALMCSLLGKGPGLTPSGDDFVAGLLLGLSRWRNAVEFSGDLRYVNRQVVRTAYEQTTTLSANLIECATTGQSDERLVNVVDGIFTGKLREPECVSSLLAWGGSSGASALAGMVLASLC